MSEVPQNWYRVTPALAGRIQARGLPPPVAFIAIGVGVMVGFAYRASLSSVLGNGLGWFVSFGLGLGLAVAIIMAVRPLGKKDRDWFAIMGDWYAIQLRLIALKAWERFYRW
jgi:L-cystine uptake protein TcyP (sodium:dicarboxylate symporter family)